MNKHIPPPLPSAAEQLLRDWPVAERDADAWDHEAQLIVAKAVSAGIGSTDDALLVAPLPEQSDDGTLDSAAPASRRSNPAAAPQSLAELARASVAKQQRDAGATDLAKETLSLASRSRSNVSEIAERVRQRADSSGRLARIEAERSSAPPSHRTDSVRPGARHLRKAPLIGGIIVMTGMAAAFALMVKRSTTEAPLADSVTSPATRAPSPASDEVQGPPETEALTVDDLPQAEPQAAPERRPVRSPSGAIAQARPTANAQQPAPASPKPGGAEPAEDPNGPPPGMQRAERSGSLPEKPSIGAVQAAIAGVLGAARACVAGHSQPSSAVLVFGSDGRVQSVTVQGPAAGTPSESCLRTALKQARVEPFALDTFTVRTPPIRP